MLNSCSRILPARCAYLRVRVGALWVCNTGSRSTRYVFSFFFYACKNDKFSEGASRLFLKRSAPSNNIITTFKSLNTRAISHFLNLNTEKLFLWLACGFEIFQMNCGEGCALSTCLLIYDQRDCCAKRVYSFGSHLQTVCEVILSGALVLSEKSIIGFTQEPPPIYLIPPFARVYRWRPQRISEANRIYVTPYLHIHSRGGAII